MSTRAKPTGDTVIVLTDDDTILECLTGMSSVRWGNGPDAEKKTFKLGHFSPRRLGDKSTLIFASYEQTMRVIRANLDKVWPFYKRLAEA